MKCAKFHSLGRSSDRLDNLLTLLEVIWGILWCFSGFKDLTLSLLWHELGSLDQELQHAICTAGKKKKEKRKLFELCPSGLGHLPQVNLSSTLGKEQNNKNTIINNRAKPCNSPDMGKVIRISFPYSFCREIYYLFPDYFCLSTRDHLSSESQP